jgi:uncharacterized protein (DUF433 family)
MKLIDRALQHTSQKMLSQLTGLSPGEIKRLRGGKLPPKEKASAHKKLRKWMGSPTYQEAKESGRRITARDFAGRSEIEIIKEQYPRLSKADIQGALERDDYTRQQLAEALTAYRAAREKITRQYHARKIKRQTLEEYIKKHTKSEYQKLSEAFEARRQTERQRTVSKVIQARGHDAPVENYGRGRGQWYSTKRL